MFLNKRNIIPFSVICLIAAFIIHICQGAYAQSQNAKRLENKEESFSRPEPKRPMVPEVPTANRYRQDKIFLEYADSLYKVKSNDTIERQILKGNVKFRQAGMWMYCDSAYYYPELNSLDAFGNVKMEQGDTLFVFADKLFYEGNERLAKLKNGPSKDKVILINNDVTLTTDSLDYDMEMEIGWYEKWGTIDDKVNTLTSLFGEYSTATKDAEFFKDVVLVNNRDGYTLYTDTLYYNTRTHLARIESLAEIQSENDTIFTRKALYDTEVGNADLLSRSLIVHRDSTGNVITLEGDSIVYDKASHISKAYMFRDRLKHSMPMVITDTAQKMTLIGGFGIFNDSTREAVATDYPLLLEYSQGDTLFLRSDTIFTFVVTEMVEVKRKYGKSGYPEKNGKPIIMADSTGIWLDSAFFAVSPPMLMLPPEAGGPPLISISEEIDVASDLPETDKEEDYIIPSDYSEALNENLFQPLVEVEESSGNIIGENTDSGAQNLNELSEIIADGINQKDVSLNEPEDTIPKEPKDFHVALAYHRARFFKKDMQGVADSIVFIERDSMLYMFRKPIVWSGERQVTGNRIDVHFNDSSADWADLPESGLLSEHVDEDFYNQISGREMRATFENETLKGLSVSGNVETIFLPQENDSTFNRLISAESSYLELEMNDGKMEKLKMWPEVNGTVTPIFLVKRAQMYLQKFRWWESLRPKREWYGGNIIWADDLGEVPDDLERYFLAPSEFGEPKTFSASRFMPPPSTLPLADEREALEEINMINAEDIGSFETPEIDHETILTSKELMEESEGESLIEQENNNMVEEIKSAIEEEE